jgi:hypothetical protein
MTTNKFTDDGYWHFVRPSWIGCNGQTIAYLDEHRNKKRRSDEETIANGHLLASAPELLARLKQALQYLEHPDVQAVTENFALSGSTMIKRIETAIAHAEGRYEGWILYYTDTPSHLGSISEYEYYQAFGSEPENIRPKIFSVYESQDEAEKARLAHHKANSVVNWNENENR